jgi:hypothetical protein
MALDLSATAAGSNHLRSLPRQIALIGLVLVGAVVTGSWGSRSTSPTGSPQLIDTSGQSYYANAHPYLEEPLEQLVERIPELKTVRPAPDQQALPMILTKTGAKVEEFFRDIVDVTAHEEITQERLNAKGAVKASRQSRYNYLILIHRDGDTPRLEEYRTDLQGNRAQPEGLDKGYTVTFGFAWKCIHFLPNLRPDSTFLYLGDERIGSQDTYVVAFAQRPGQATITSKVRWEGGIAPILVQGIAWVDKSSFQIIRLRTDLLAPRNDMGLSRETTELSFSEVQLPDVTMPLWLPREVSVTSDFRGNTFRNEHRYSGYEHFRVSVKIGPQ